MSAHTPGPWQVSEIDATGERSEHYIFIEPGVAVIERKVAGNDESDMPDARLIAAAPELLGALRELLDAGDDCVTADDGFAAMVRFAEAHKAALAAIAKATGEQQ